MAAMIVHCRSILIAFACIGCACGCQPAPSQPARQPYTVTVNAPQAPGQSDAAARPEQIEGALRSDPCSVRMQQIGGALLEYYALHARLPGTLQQLTSLPDLEQPLVFSCPASGKPFVYVPAGLASADDPRPVILYDPAVDHAGLRWVLRLRRPTHREAAATFVEHLPQSVFENLAPLSP